MKIYTKTGDDATSGLFGGTRVDKHHLRLVCYGELDELNAFIGQLVDAEPGKTHLETLYRIQRQIFSVSALLATEEEKRSLLRIEIAWDKEVAFLEQEIDRMNQTLPELTNFVLPGGHPLVSHCHVCRTVGRRAERSISLLHQREGVEKGILSWINRLSDFFFVLGRLLCQENGGKEIPWKP